eukprot:1559603-Prymnesium_polylepis.1
MVRLGREMGEDFGRGLLKAPGASRIKQEQTRLQATFKGDAPTAASALSAVLAVATSLGELKIGNVGNKGGLELRADMKRLDLSKRKLGDAAACFIAAFTSVRKPSLTFVDISSNSIGDAGMKYWGESLLASSTSKLSAIKCDAFEVSSGATSADLSGKGITVAAATLLAGIV